MSKKLDQHALVAQVRDLALELGRTPTRAEFRKYSRTAAENYTALCISAGLEHAGVPQRKVTNAVFEVSIDRHLEKYVPRKPLIQEPYQPTLFVPDIHFPFHHQPTLDKIYRFAEKEGPTTIVQVGDLYDAYSHAKFPKSSNVFTPRDEAEKARKLAENFWAELHKIAPKARKVQICGNHDVRILKRILEVYPAGEDWIARMLSEVMSFPNVETIMDTRQELLLPGDVAVIHGFKSQLGQHRDSFLHNVVTGHLHTGGVSYRHIHGRTLWELNVGLAGDAEAKGLQYTPSRITTWTLGWGWLDEYGPRFICA